MWPVPMNRNFTPIDKRKIYCGNNSEKPDGYDSIGSLSQCLQKGIGIGKRKRGILGYSPNYSPNYSPTDYSPSNNYFFKMVVIFIVIEVLIFCYLYFSRPKIVTTKDHNKDHKKIERINWSKFILIYLTSVFLSSLILFLIYISNVSSNS